MISRSWHCRKNAAAQVCSPLLRIWDPGPFLTRGSGILIKGTEEQATGQAGKRPTNRGHVGALCEYTSSVFQIQINCIRIRNQAVAESGSRPRFFMVKI
jgi:hypothetical protein